VAWDIALTGINFSNPTFNNCRSASRNIDNDHGRARHEANSGRDCIMPENISMRLGARYILIFVLLFLFLAGSPAFARAARSELLTEPDVRQNATNRIASAYVVAGTSRGGPISEGL
jgi:hypothetical protein